MKEAITFSKKDRVKDLTFRLSVRLSKIQLLIKIIQVCPIPDLEMERLTGLRKITLLKRLHLSTNEELIHFQSALALQCFTNEYIYEENREEETAEVRALEVSLQKSYLSNEELSSYGIACLASYRSLLNYPWAMEIKLVHFRTLFKRQVVEPTEEILTKKDIPRLSPIKDTTSAVKEQYEENPYPRWVNIKLEVNPLGIKEFVSKTELRIANEIGLLNDILRYWLWVVNGQHALTTATRFKNCYVTAIDLSLSSLAYAKRKTEELGITNINYMHGDLLDLKMLDKQFDIVESSGVLHHMADPIAGWKVLTDCLKPNGLMNIGLYSELGRQNIVKARGIIAERSISSDKEGMSKFRQEIINLNDPLLNTLQRSGDFYSISTIRDLLFHVQEHRFTIPQICEAQMN